MADFLKEAIEMVKAQANLKEMTPEQTMELVAKYQASFIALSNVPNESLAAGKFSVGSIGQQSLPTSAGDVTLTVDPQKALKDAQPEKIICAICGHKGKTLGRHLTVAHKMTPKEYRKICGYDSKTHLSAKESTKKRQAIAAKNKPYEKSPKYKQSQAAKKEKKDKGAEK